MAISKRLTILSLAVGLLTGQSAGAVEVLLNGGFENVVNIIDGWTLEGFRSANPSVPAEGGAVVTFANDPDGEAGFGFWLRAFAGNPTDGVVDAVLTQVVPATPGENYSFSGRGSFEGNYAGGVTTLDAGSPFGAVPSTTRTEFELAFLDSNGMVIGAPTVRNVASEVFNGLGWGSVTPVSGIAPANAASVRVRAQGRDMQFNIDPQQTAFLDRFSLTKSSTPSTELLTNAGLATGSQEVIQGWTFVEPEGVDTVSLAGFANNPASGGVNGVWIRSFATGDSTVEQKVPGVVGGEYTLSASSRWEENYSGGQEGTGTETLLELTFLDGSGQIIGTSNTLDLRTVQMNDNTWRTQSLTATAPVGTVDVYVAGITTGMVSTTGAQSAFWDDFSLMLASAGLPGDYNSDGMVDAADYTVWRDGGSPDNTPAGYSLWASNYGTTLPPSSALGVPEPATALLMALALLAAPRRRA